jgi:flagellar motor switch protein FliN/FliY
MSEPAIRKTLLDLEVPVEIWLASEDVPLERLLELEAGGTLPLSRDPDGPVELVVNGVVVATGELVVVDGKFGFRVIANTQQRIADRGAAAGRESQS